jgi:integrase
MATTPKPITLKNGQTKWRVQFRIDGHVLSERFATPEAAYDFIHIGEQNGWATAIRARDAADSTRQGDQPLKTIFDEYLENLRGVTPGTASDYRRIAKISWLPALGNLPIAAIIEEDVADWIDAELSKPVTRGRRSGRTLSAKTVRNRHTILSQCLAYAVKKRYVPVNVAAGVEIRDDGDHIEPIYIEPETFAQIHANVMDEYKLFTRFLYTTGLRWGEATALQVKDIAFAKTATVRVVRAWKLGPRSSRYLGEPKTKKGRRTVPIPEDVAVDLAEAIQGKGLTDFVFTSLTGRVMAVQWFRERVWIPALDAAKVPVHPRIHDLRHSYGSNLLASGVPLYVVQEMMGHESIDTTRKIYMHLDHEAGARAAKAAGESLAYIGQPEARAGAPGVPSEVAELFSGMDPEKVSEFAAAMKLLLRA